MIMDWSNTETQSIKFFFKVGESPEGKTKRNIWLFLNKNDGRFRFIQDNAIRRKLRSTNQADKINKIFKDIKKCTDYCVIQRVYRDGIIDYFCFDGELSNLKSITYPSCGFCRLSKATRIPSQFADYCLNLIKKEWPYYQFNIISAHD